MDALHNPSFASQVLSVSNTFMKWSALILALIASFTTIVNRVRILIIKLQRHPSLVSQQQSIVSDEDDDYDSETASSSSFSDEEDEQEEDGEEETARTSFRAEEDFCVRGSGHVCIDEQWQNRNMGVRRRRRRSIGDLFSWSELAGGGKSVVKLWDSFGLGLDFDDNEDENDENEVVPDSGNLFAIYGMSGERGIGRIPVLVAGTSPSPAVVMSAAADRGGRVELKGWDARIGSRIPAILAEWRPKLGNVVRVWSGGEDKVYLRDDVRSSALTVGDVRKVNAPLEEALPETEVDTWWDADAVVVTNEYFHEST